jgi:hypothetical protein
MCAQAYRPLRPYRQAWSLGSYERRIRRRQDPEVSSVRLNVGLDPKTVRIGLEAGSVYAEPACPVHSDMRSGELHCVLCLDHSEDFLALRKTYHQQSCLATVACTCCLVCNMLNFTLFQQSLWRVLCSEVLPPCSPVEFYQSFEGT